LYALWPRQEFSQGFPDLPDGIRPTDLSAYLRLDAVIQALRPVRCQGRIPVGVTPTGLGAGECRTDRNAGTAVLVRA
jgi:hypothetical protein